MKRILLLVLILTCQVSIAQQEEIQWMNFEELDDSLNIENRPVVIYFYTDWCVYCKKMDRNAFQNRDVVNKLNTDFYAVKMNAESTEAIEFEGQVFTNEEHKTKRRGIHQIPLLLASREDQTLSFPVVMVLDKDFRVRIKSHEYLTSDQLKSMINGNYENAF